MFTIKWSIEARDPLNDAIEFASYDANNLANIQESCTRASSMRENFSRTYQVFIKQMNFPTDWNEKSKLSIQKKMRTKGIQRNLPVMQQTRKWKSLKILIYGLVCGRRSCASSGHFFFFLKRAEEKGD